MGGGCKLVAFYLFIKQNKLLLLFYFTFLFHIFDVLRRFVFFMVNRNHLLFNLFVIYLCPDVTWGFSDAFSVVSNIVLFLPVYNTMPRTSTDVLASIC